MSKDKPALIVRNKTATRNYKLGESFQAGIVSCCSFIPYN
jgi:tmRNA-binding protein